VRPQPCLLKQGAYVRNWRWSHACINARMQIFICSCVCALVPAIAAESCAATPSSLPGDFLVNPYERTQVCVLVL